jgi:hypothetical protein
MKKNTKRRLRFLLKIIKKYRPVFQDGVVYFPPKGGWADLFERDSHQKGYL